MKVEEIYIQTLKVNNMIYGSMRMSILRVMLSLFYPKAQFQIKKMYKK